MADVNVVIDPEIELKFKGTLKESTSVQLRIYNKHADKHTAFKIKTTAPKSYNVKPNNGFIPANTYIDVTIILNPDETLERSMHKHKFQLKFLNVNKDECGDVTKLFNEENEPRIKQHILRCIFEKIDSKMDETQDGIYSPELPGNNQKRSLTSNTSLENQPSIKQQPLSKNQTHSPISNTSNLLVILMAFVFGYFFAKLF